MVSAIERLRDQARDNGPNMRSIAPAVDATPRSVAPPATSGMSAVGNYLARAFPTATESIVGARDAFREGDIGSAVGQYARGLTYGVGRDAINALLPVGDAYMRNASAFFTGDPGAVSREIANLTAQPETVPRPDTQPSAIASMQSVQPGTGFIERADGTGRVSVGDTPRFPVSDVDFREADQRFARANDIRRETIASLPRGAGVVRPQGDPVSDIYSRAEEIMRQATESNSADERSGLFRLAAMLSGQGDSLAGVERQRVADQGAMARAQLGADVDRDVATARMQGLIQSRGAGLETLSATDIESLINSGVMRLTEDGQALDLEDPNTLALYTRFLQNLGFADGGYVESPSAMRSFASGGYVEPAAPPAMPVLREYQAYSRGAMERGLDPVSFDQFISLRQGAQQRMATPGRIGMADGGMVPDTSGKMVVDTDPNASTDSIPAMIDGQQPAALDSGEFVMPKDAVLFYGTDKLQKMIEKARKPADGGQDSAAAGISAMASVR